MKYKTPHDFYLDVNAKKVGGGQCGQLFNYFNAEMLNGIQILCTETGFVKDLWNQRNSNNILKYYDIVSVNDMKDGDWVVYGESDFAPLSHVAMFRKDNGNGTGVFLQQNDLRNPEKTAQNDNPYKGIIGVFRLKNWYTVKSNLKEIDEIAQDVIKGLYGNGEERKEKLKKEGYDYRIVQEKVNEILKYYSKDSEQIDKIVYQVIRGEWGNGEERVNRLNKAGYNYQIVQNRVNQILSEKN